MARVTVEDCLDNVNNRFDLVRLAAKRARQLVQGRVDPTLPWDDHKPTVLALKEIANGLLVTDVNTEETTAHGESSI